MRQLRHVRRWDFKNLRREIAKKDRVVIVGSHVQGLFMRVSRFPQADETVLGWDFKEALDGGKGSHQAIACARLGLPASFVGRIGNDRLGELGASWMADAGVDLKYLYRSEKTSTGCGFVMINPNGIPAMTTAMGANEEFSTVDIDRAEPLLARAKVVVITFEIPVPTALYAAKLAKALGAFTILTPAPAETLPREALSGVDLLVPNEGEARTLLGSVLEKPEPSDQLVSRLRTHFHLPQVVMTMGERGAFLTDGTSNHHVPAFPVKVVDTPGAGDSFTAGLTYGLFHAAPLIDAARFGCLTAARSVTVRESIPGFGTMREIQDFAKQNGFENPLLGKNPVSW